jgi:hypothetical protein
MMSGFTSIFLLSPTNKGNPRVIPSRADDEGPPSCKWWHTNLNHRRYYEDAFRFAQAW